MISLFKTSRAALLLAFAIPGLLSPIACQPSRPQSHEQQLLIDWLKNHGEPEVIADRDGVGIKGNPTRLRTVIYKATEHARDRHVVELEFRARLGHDREIVEFVAGMGTSLEQARSDAFANLVLTTLHVVYKAFLNPADPHQSSTMVTIGTVQRQLVAGNLYSRGTTNSTRGLDNLQPQLEKAVCSVSYSADPHWIKVVYSHANGAAGTVEVTVDNTVHPGLTDAIRNLGWPTSTEFYLAKEFLILQ